MDINSLYNFHQAVQPISGGAETLSTSSALPSDQAPAPPSVSSQTHRRTRVRKTNSPSCNLCRRRKIKCDRADPCSHCVRAGAVCVSSAPSGAARGRKGGRRKVDSELLDRIAKLENLVKNIEGGTIAATPPLVADGNRTVRHPFRSSISRSRHPTKLIHKQASDESDIPLAKSQPIKPSPKAPKEGLDRYLGSSLWMSLSDEASILLPPENGQVENISD
jgi:Fungal Zn(2)-Cys(6) binuclear cluster domain